MGLKIYTTGDVFDKYKSETAANIIEALKKCSDSESKTIVVFGSLYLIGSVLKIN